MSNTDTKMLELFTDISAKLGDISGQMRSVLSQLADHTFRIQQLEHQPKAQGQTSGLKDDIIKWLIIALIGCVGIIATLTGSTAIVKAMMGM